MQVVCGGHQYLCLDAPNSSPGEFSLMHPVTNSLLNVNSGNLNENLSVSWSESYDSDGHDLHYTFVFFTTFPSQDTLFSASTVNEVDLSISYQSIYNLLGPNNSVNCYWDVFVTDLYDTTGTDNGPFFLQLSSDVEGGLNQPPTAFNLDLLQITLFYMRIPSNLDDMFTFQWDESVDPDGNDVTYHFIVESFTQHE